MGPPFSTSFLWQERQLHWSDMLRSASETLGFIKPELDPCAAAGSEVLGRYSASLVTQHVIRQAVAVARLIGVPAPVHVRQVERPDGPQRAARREEFAD